ncbi:MAG: hypothetical protein WBP40_03190 [Candidatus Moraniibacteriota bacterium]
MTLLSDAARNLWRNDAAPGSNRSSGQGTAYFGPRLEEDEAIVDHVQLPWAALPSSLPRTPTFAPACGESWVRSGREWMVDLVRAKMFTSGNAGEPRGGGSDVLHDNSFSKKKRKA